jgi:hypothetical protein
MLENKQRRLLLAKEQAFGEMTEAEQQTHMFYVHKNLAFVGPAYARVPCESASAGLPKADCCSPSRT